MESSKSTKIQFIKSDSKELESIVQNLFDNKEGFEIQDANLMITHLEFLIDTSFRRGSFGDFHECYKEYIIKNSPLSVLLIFIYDEKFMPDLLKTKKIKIYNGEFAQYFKTFEGKDSNSVTRYTFNNFHLGHLMVGFERDQIKEFLTTNETCGEFEVQHKSAQYMSHEDDKYSQGYKEKITSCTLVEMKKLDKKIDDMAEHKETKKSSPKKGKSKK
jgi:hypothetical protein